MPLAVKKRGKEIDYQVKTVTLAGRRYIVCRNHQEAIAVADQKLNKSRCRRSVKLADQMVKLLTSWTRSSARSRT